MSSDDEHEQMRKAIAMSLDPQSPAMPIGASSHTPPKCSPSKMTRDQMKQTELPQMDRRSMEQERLARLNKRKASQKDDIRGGDGNSQAKRHKTNAIDLETTFGDAPNHPSSRVPQPSKVHSNPTTSFAPGSFLEGVIKRTWAFGYARDADIKIEEVLQKDRIKVAVLGSFQWDLEWLLPKFVADTKMVLSKGLNKLMLLFYDNYLRIVVPTANLTKYDWGETGFTENLVFLIDLPRLTKGPEQDQTAFQQELMHFLNAMDMDSGVCAAVSRFDFTETSRLAFIHTIAGSHLDEDAARTGFLGLASSVRRLNLKSSANLHLDYATASLGALNERLMGDLYRAAMGIESTLDPNQPIKDLGKHLQDHFRVYFPSHETVMNTKGKTNGAGTICLLSKYWNAATFPRKCMRDHVSTRPGLLSHNKLLLARGQHDDAKVAWVYVGSANLSESAWGRLVKDRTKKVSKLNCRNWECGVLLPVPDEAIRQLEVEEIGAPMPIHAFNTQFKLPFKYPGEESGSKEPWLFTKFHPPTFGGLQRNVV